MGNGNGHSLRIDKHQNTVVSVHAHVEHTILCGVTELSNKLTRRTLIHDCHFKYYFKGK